jgi:hypothetical protein
LLCDIRREPAGRQIVQKEERARALHKNVVHAVIDEIGANCVVPAAHEGDLQLRSDTVSAGDQHWFSRSVCVQLKQATERSNL